MKFNVLKGEYPFNEIMGRIEVEEKSTPEETAELALYIATEKFGGHPVVVPTNELAQ